MPRELLIGGLTTVLLLFSSLTIANSISIIPVQGTIELSHQTSPAHLSTTSLQLTIKQTGLLLITSQQRGDDLSHKITINSEYIGEVNALNITQGPEIAAVEVTADDVVTIEVISPPSHELNKKIITTTRLLTASSSDFITKKKTFLSISAMGIAFAKSSQASLDTYQQLLEEALTHNAQATDGLRQLSLTPYYELMHALLLHDVGQLVASRELFETLLSTKKTMPTSMTMLTKYFYSQYFRSAIKKDAVLPLLKEVLELATLHDDKSTLQNASVDICTIHAQNDRNTLALDCFESILLNQLLLDDPYKLAIMTSNLANVYQKTGQHRLAISHRNDALQLIEKVKDWPGYSTVYKLQKALYLRHQATHLLSLGRNNNALTNHLASLKIFKLLKRQRFINFTLLDLSRLYLSYDQPHLAQRFAKALYQSSLSEKASRGDNFHFNSAVELMSINQELDDITQAQHYYQIALKAAKKNNSIRQQSILSLRSLSLNYVPKEQQQILTILRATLASTQHGDIVNKIDIKLSKSYLQAKKYKLALTSLNGLKDSELSFDQRLETLYLKSRLLLQSHQHTDALSTINHADELITEHFENLDNVGLKRSFYHQHQQVFSLKTAILVALHQQTNDQKYLWQASESNQISLNQRRNNNVEQTKQNRRFKLAQVVNQHNKSTPQNLSIEFIEQLLALENIDNNSSLNIAASSKSSEFKTKTSGRFKIKDTTLHYVLASPSSYLFILNSDNIRLKILPDQKQLSKDIDSLLIAINQTQPRAFGLAKGLALQLLPQEIFESQSDTIANINVIASGALWQLPFSLLPLKYSERWQDDLLIDHFALSKRTSYRNVPELLPPERFLVISDPVYSFQDKRALNLAMNEDTTLPDPLPRLMSTRLETQAIERHFSQKDVLALDGFSAMKNAVVKTIEQDYQVIHIASHGFSNQDNHHDAGLYFSAIDADGKKDNNLLSLYEIEQLNSSAQLVVLSACQTNVGKAFFRRASDGIALSFLHTGVRNVIASQWPVPSRSTAKLMQAFYYQLSLANSNYTKALRAAMLTVRKKQADPSRWAGFTLINNS